MAQQYYGLLTNIGLAKLAAAAAGGGVLSLSTMGFGDGGGAETAPAKTNTALVNERYRAPVVEKYPHPTNPSILYVEGVIPSGIGGWTMREAGIFDSAGDLIVIAKPPAMDVALISEGASTEGIVRLPLVFESLDAVQLLIDPTVVLATQGWVLDRLLSRPFITVDSITTAAPPAAPAAHSLYVVPTGATGAWAAQVGKLAYFQGGWIYRDGPAGKIVAASDTGKYWRRTAAGWVEWVASEAAAGLVELATAAEVRAGTDSQRAVTPAGVARASQEGGWNFAVAGGTANALTATLAPMLLAHSAGMGLRLKITATNTGAATLNAGPGALPIVTQRGQAVNAGDLPAGAIATLVCTGTAWMMAGAAYSEFRWRLRSDLTLYTSPTGNDANDGLTPASAMREINGALLKAMQQYDSSGRLITIVAADGSYGPVYADRMGASRVQISGNYGSPAACVIAGGTGDPVTAISGSVLDIGGFRLTGTGAMIASSSATIRFSNLDFSNGASLGQNYATYGGTIIAVGDYLISAGAQQHVTAGPGGVFVSTGRTATLSNAPAFWGQFANANGGFIGANGMTFMGTGATGQRYNANMGGSIFVGGAGANYFPGNTSGGVSSGGIYA